MTLSSTGCGCTAPCACIIAGPALDPSIPGSPTVRVRFNDGAVLDAHDLRLEQNAHVWQDRLRTLFLHGPGGVVWGLSVTLDPDGRLLRVHPGVATDPRGRLLLSQRDLCLDLQRLPEAFLGELEPDDDDNVHVFVVISFEACVSEAVTALRPACAEPPSVAWSRQLDGVRIDLAATAPAPPLAWLRRWLGRPETTIEGADPWLGHPSDLGELHARLLESSTGPATSLQQIWEDDTPVPLLLAELTLTPGDPGPTLVSLDLSGRALMAPTQWLAHQQLGGAVVGEPAATASVRVARVETDGASIQIALTGPLNDASVTTDAVEMWVHDGTVWNALTATAAHADATLTITPVAAPAAGSPVQVLLRGVGVHALIGADGAPFAGEGPPTGLPRAHDLTLVATWS